MSQNTDNAIHGLQEARAAIFVETGDVRENDPDDELEQLNKLRDIEGMMNKTEQAIKDYINDS